MEGNQNFNQNFNQDFNQPVNQPVNQNYLILAIVATIFGCCSSAFLYLGFILGIIAIVFAAQVNSKTKIGDYITANKYSGYAKKLSIASIIVTVLSMAYLAYDFKTDPEKYDAIREQLMKGYEESQSHNVEQDQIQPIDTVN